MIIQIRGRLLGIAKMRLSSYKYFVLLIYLLLAACSSDALTTEISPVDGSKLSHTETKAAADSSVATSSPTSPETSPLTAGVTLKQLTSGACCVSPFWSPDSQHVYYIDRPDKDYRSGIWSVDTEVGKIEFLTEKMGVYSADMNKRAFFENGNTYVENLPTGEIWMIPNGGKEVLFSQDGEWLTWIEGQSGPPFNNIMREIWISRFDGSQPMMVSPVLGNNTMKWFPDGRILVNGHVPSTVNGQGFWILNPRGEQAEPTFLVELPVEGRVRNSSISPSGNWLVYLVTFSGDPNFDGIWLVDTRTSEKLRLEVFGAFQWRDGERLLVIPLDLTQVSHYLLQIDASTGDVEYLTDPEIDPFKIANGDWSVSPDGRRITFVSAADNNIWVLTIVE